MYINSFASIIYYARFYNISSTTLATRRLTRNHEYSNSIILRVCEYDYFSSQPERTVNERNVNIWNSLPNSVVDASTVNAFKARLDKFWSHQAVKFDFTADLTGTGNRSEELKKL